MVAPRHETSAESAARFVAPPARPDYPPLTDREVR